MRARHTATTGRQNSPQTFRAPKCYCKVLVLYQIDRDFQIASHLRVESEVCMRVKSDASVAREERNADRRCVGSEFGSDDFSSFETTQERAALNFLNDRIED